MKNITTLLADDLAGHIAQELLRATIPGSDIQPVIDREGGVGSAIDHIVSINIVSINYWENPNRYCPQSFDFSTSCTLTNLIEIKKARARFP